MLNLTQRTTVFALAAALAAAPAAVALAPTSAEARACSIVGTLRHSNGTIFGARQIFCDPPGTESFLLVTIQRKVGTGFVNVAFADGNDGGAVYHCAGKALNTYRLKEMTHRTIKAACS